MAWELNADRPIYVQLVDTLRLRILTGYYPAGGKLPPVRELAAEAAVNPNTMQRALAELETDGLVYTQRTSGRFVTDDRQLLEELRRQLARRQLEKLLTDMKELGYSPEETARLLEQMIGERQE
ncbi:MAG: GntR family transcriptional regulator [Oscillospiraceae bacterium]|nr:GntR family transcriptional regulator [Oscillospiraceae bacterium]